MHHKTSVEGLVYLLIHLIGVWIYFVFDVISYAVCLFFLHEHSRRVNMPSLFQDREIINFKQDFRLKALVV